jgi:hypothetical protein
MIEPLSRTARPAIRHWRRENPCLTTLWVERVKIGDKVVRYAKYSVSPMAEVVAAKDLFRTIRARIWALAEDVAT